MKFEEYFNSNIKTLKEFMEDPKKFFVNNTGNDLYEKLIYLKEYINIIKSKSFDKCLLLGKKLFYLNYIRSIEVVLAANPPDKLLKDGSKFWKGANRIPHTIVFNIDDDINYLFIEYFSYLLADSLSIPINNDTNYKKQFLKLSKINVTEGIFDTTEADLAKQAQKMEKLKSELYKLYSEQISEEEIHKIQEQHFEKDHDENHQIDFLYISSNLRASNFNIDLCSRDKVKFISGNIVPSIPTTTSCIVGYISSQIYSLLQTTEILKLKQINIDLSTPFFLLVYPKRPYQNKDSINPETKILSKAIPPKFTCWDILDVKGNKTTGEVLDYISETYKVDVTGLYTLNSKSIIKDEASFDMLFQDAYFKAIGKDKPKNNNRANIYFKVLADVSDSNDHAIMPKFRYIY